MCPNLDTKVTGKETHLPVGSRVGSKVGDNVVGSGVEVVGCMVKVGSSVATVGREVNVGDSVLESLGSAVGSTVGEYVGVGSEVGE